MEIKWQQLKENGEHLLRCCINKVRANALGSLGPGLKIRAEN
jgi:hypothetical protein